MTLSVNVMKKSTFYFETFSNRFLYLFGHWILKLLPLLETPQFPGSRPSSCADSSHREKEQVRQKPEQQPEGSMCQFIGTANPPVRQYYFPMKWDRFPSAITCAHTSSPWKCSTSSFRQGLGGKEKAEVASPLCFLENPTWMGEITSLQWIIWRNCGFNSLGWWGALALGRAWAEQALTALSKTKHLPSNKETTLPLKDTETPLCWWGGANPLQDMWRVANVLFTDLDTASWPKDITRSWEWDAGFG